MSEQRAWTYDPTSATFEQVKASSGDKARMDNYIVYDEADDLIVIYTINDEFNISRYVPPGDTK